jgi:hypothetical protein
MREAPSNLNRQAINTINLPDPLLYMGCLSNFGMALCGSAALRLVEVDVPKGKTKQSHTGPGVYLPIFAATLEAGIDQHTHGGPHTYFGCSSTCLKDLFSLSHYRFL